MVVKALKKAKKKAAKKAAKKSPHGDANRDLRRAYEHLNRVRILHLGLHKDALQSVELLSRMAQAAMTAGDPKSAADLLRAAEHLAFGSMAKMEPEQGMSVELTTAAQKEYEHLLERSHERRHKQGDKIPADLRAIYKTMLAHAKEAYARSAFHRSLEFVRGAEALMHTELEGRLNLPARGSELRLR